MQAEAVGSGICDCKSSHFSLAQMPLAHNASLVTGLLQLVSHSGLIEWEARVACGAKYPRHPNPLTLPPGHQGRTAGSADRIATVPSAQDFPAAQTQGKWVGGGSCCMEFT